MAPAKNARSSKAKPKSRSPSEIAPGVFVGGWNDAIKFEGARFCVLDEAPKDMPPATHVPIYSEEEDRANTKNLDRLAEEIGAARAKGEPVLLFCGHGVRRSPLAGAWYLRRSQGLSLDEAYDRVRAARPKVEHARQWIGHASELEQP
jgi:protein-tyrosine phosphatase